MLDLSFLVGLALGTIVTGFCAIGSFNRGLDSQRRTSWSRELAARKRAVVASQSVVRMANHRGVRGALNRAS